ncbi:MAG: efflux RND transporter periplasmic adaptor subunit [Cytophagales bacterium]|nr:efflux RND transporter periplasmic adaptor subunit [Cytophagales bacterium]
MAKKKKSNRLLYIVLGVVIIVIVLAVIKGSSGGDGSTEVEIAKAIKATIVEKVSASGAVQPVVEVKISPEVPGEIIELNIEEGDSVNRGDFLLKIRPDNFISARDRAVANYNQQRANLKSAESSFSRAKASFIRAEQDWKRQQELYSKKVISVADFETAKANFEIANQDQKAAEQSVDAAGYILVSANASVTEANENLRLTKITSPMNGIVSKLAVEKGETVVGTSQMQGTEMLRIADLSKMEVRVDVNENDIIRINVGDKVEIDVDSYSHLDKTFEGVVTQIANSANDKISADAVTEFEVRILVLNSSYQDLVKEGTKYPFRPGMTASVDIITESKEGILTVPLASVTTRVPESEEDDEEAGDKDSDDEAEEVVFILKEGVAVQTKVKTGISDFENIEIINGLREGTEVISGPFIEVSKRLEDGDKVEPEKKEKKKDKDKD